LVFTGAADIGNCFKAVVYGSQLAMIFTDAGLTHY